MINKLISNATTGKDNSFDVGDVLNVKSNAKGFDLDKQSKNVELSKRA